VPVRGAIRADEIPLSSCEQSVRVQKRQLPFNRIFFTTDTLFYLCWLPNLAQRDLPTTWETILLDSQASLDTLTNVAKNARQVRQAGLNDTELGPL